jgi:hypothetical protein
MVTDDELAELMKQAVADVYPSGALVTEAEQRGHRLRRRRLAWIVGGNAAAVAAIAVLVTTVMQLPTSRQAADSGSLTPGASSGQASGSAHARASATASASPMAPTPVPSEPPMTTDQMLAVLRSLLPAGSALSDVRSNIGPGSLEVNYNDGNGLADIMVDTTPFTSVVSESQTP